MRKTNEPLSLDGERERFFSLLLRRSCTRREARTRLGRRGIDEETVESLLLEAQEMGLLDDVAYARLFAGSHEAWGDGRIAYELGHRGLSDEDIQAGLEEIPDEGERLRPLVASWRKGGLEERKIAARLYRRGFSGQAIRSACQEDFEEEFF